MEFLSGIWKRLRIVMLFLFVISIGVLTNIGLNYFYPKLNSVKVVVASRDIARGEVFKESDYKLIAVPTEAEVPSRVKYYTDFLKREAVRDVKANEQITFDMVKDSHLKPNVQKGEENMLIPDSWILSKPWSLLRGDRISIMFVKKEEPTDSTSGSETGFQATGDIQVEETTNAEGDVKTSAKKAPKELIINDPLLTDIIVSYSKGSNNQEVTSESDRKKPSGVVRQVEIIVNEKQKNIIAKYAMSGYQMVIAYQ